PRSERRRSIRRNRRRRSSDFLSFPVVFTSNFVNQSFDIILCILYRSARSGIGACRNKFPMIELHAIGAEGFPKEFADIAALFIGYGDHLLCQLFGEADGEDTGGTGTGGFHGVIIT